MNANKKGLRTRHVMMRCRQMKRHGSRRHKAKEVMEAPSEEINEYQK